MCRPWHTNKNYTEWPMKNSLVLVSMALRVLLITKELTNELHGAESFLTRNSPHFMETEVSLPHSQETATCPYPEPD